MLARPPQDPSLAPPAPPPSIAKLSGQLLALIEEALTLLSSCEDKENRSGNASQVNAPESLQLTRCREILSRAHEQAGFMHAASNKKGPQIKQDSRSALMVTANTLRQCIDALKIQAKQSANCGRQQQKTPLQAKLKECLSALDVLAATFNINAKSDKESSKRSLLTQKIKQAEREQSQSEAMMQTIRVNPSRITGNLIQQTKVRDRTAPLKARNFDSLLRGQKFSFSDVEIEGAEEDRVRKNSSRILLSEMSEDGDGRERKAKPEVGCARCEIY